MDSKYRDSRTHTKVICIQIRVIRATYKGVGYVLAWSLLSDSILNHLHGQNLVFRDSSPPRLEALLPEGIFSHQCPQKVQLPTWEQKAASQKSSRAKRSSFEFRVSEFRIAAISRFYASRDTAVQYRGHFNAKQPSASSGAVLGTRIDIDREILERKTSSCRPHTNAEFNNSRSTLSKLKEEHNYPQIIEGMAAWHQPDVAEERTI
jgi:hypothetical protein